MGRDLEDILRTAGEGAADLWHQVRAKAVADADEAYLRGRQAYADAVRTGRSVLAQTPQQVKALGGAVNAGVRSAANAATFDLADKAEAAAGALFGGGGRGTFKQRYRNQMAEQQALDHQAAQEHPFATQAGNVLGSIGGILALDSPAAAGWAARAIPGGADVLKTIQGAKRVGFVPEGLATMSTVGGGVAGGGIQIAADAVRHRQTSLQDFLGAVGGGALSGRAIAAGAGPVIGAALGGGTTAALQGGDLQDITRGAMGSAVGGRVLGTLGEQISNDLPIAAKGVLGERLTYLKSLARNEPIPFREGSPSPAVAQNFPTAAGKAGPQLRIGLGGRRYTRADWLTEWGRALEAKFGPFAELSPSQTLAAQKFGPLYQPDHWLQSDIGDFSGGWLAPAAGEQPHDSGGRW